MIKTVPVRARRSWLAASVALAVGAVGVATLSPQRGTASSHREAPLVAADPQVDTTDVYAFVSPDDPDKVTFIMNYIPFEEPAGGPNFYSFQPGVRYQLNIDNDADARADIKYRFVFRNHRRNPETFLYNTGQVTSLDDPDLNFYQTYSVSRVEGKSTQKLAGGGIVAPSHVGDPSMPDYAALRDAAIVPLTGGGRAWAGQADDPFFLDLRVFDLLYGTDLSEVGDDTLAGFNVHSMALQIPLDDIAKGGDAEANPIVGAWAVALRRSVTVQDATGGLKREGKFVQVSRLGMPLVNEVVIPVGLKDRWNASKPKGDAQFLKYVTEPEVPKLLELIYGLTAPATPRDDLVAVFLTGVEGLNQPPGVTPSEMLRLNMSIPPCEPGTCAEHSPLGVIGGDIAGYPNGRRLVDDTIDISLQVVAGELVGSANDLGDGVDGNDIGFTSTFPYVGLPHSGSSASPH